MIENGKEYLPYEATAKVIIRGDDDVPSFLRSIFPDASDKDIDKFRHFIAGKLHDGIELGLAMSDIDPITPIEAYADGEQHGWMRGYGQALYDLVNPTEEN